MSGGDWKEMFNAGCEGDLELVKHHVKAGVDVNYAHPEFLSTPLVAAILAKQEKVALALAELASGTCLVVCGGAILDFLGGKVDRAPASFRSMGLEWLYRLVLEPRRLFKRYVFGNPLFLFRTAWFRGRVGRSAFSGAPD